MASLTGQTISSTYDSLLKVTDNGPLNSSLKTITDGLGNSSSLQLSTVAGYITGGLTVTGQLTLPGAFDLTVNGFTIGKGPGALDNTVYGFQSLLSNTTGVFNTANGYQSLYNNTIGEYNTSFGLQSMFSNVAGGNNVGIGANSLPSNTSGNNNTAIGRYAGFGTGTNNNITGSNNIFIGYQSVGISSSESNRTWIGNSSTLATWVGGNLLIGATTNNGFGLEVTGTSKISGQLTLGSTITNGTYTYTLPSATGTLALTTDIHSAVTLSAIGSTPNANGATLTGQVLNLQPASSSFGGVITTGSQTIAGDKTLTGALVGTTGSFSSSGGSDSFAINHSSGAGIALNITKGGNNEGIYVNKTSGSGNAVTIIGTLNATTLVKSGGTSSEFLKADGSVDSTAYGTGSVTSVAALTLGTTGTDLSSTVANGTTTPVITLNVPDASATARGVVTTGTQTFAGDKTLTGTLYGIGLSMTGTSADIISSVATTGKALRGAATTGFGVYASSTTGQAIYAESTGTGGSAVNGTAANGIGGYFFNNSTGFTTLIVSNFGSGNLAQFSNSAGTKFTINNAGNLGNGTYTYTLPSATGTLALTSAIPANPVGGTGTTNYVPKFTGASTIGNSLVYDNGTNVGINQASPTRTLDILGASGIGTVLKLQGGSGTTTYLQMAYNGATNAQSGYIGYNSSSQMQFFTNDTVALTIDSNRNLGLGVTPSAWNLSGLKAFQIGAVSTIFDFSDNLYITRNRIYDSGNKYQKNGFAQTYEQDSLGQHVWLNAPSGTAGNAITFTQAMTLFSTGNLGVGVGGTDAGYKLDVNGTGRFSGKITSTTGGIEAQEGYIDTYHASSVTESGYYLRSFTNTTGSTKASIGDFGVLQSASSQRKGKFFIDLANGSTPVRVFTILNTGEATFTSTVTATGFFESSSVVGKDIIKTNPLTNLNLDVIQYTRKTDENKDVRYGYSAEQIHSLMPELTDKDVTAVKYLDVHTLLIAQLQQEIKELKAKLN